MRSILEDFGVPADEANIIWPGPIDMGHTVQYQNALGVEDPKTRLTFEEAVGRASRARKGGEQPSSNDIEVIQGVLRRFGIPALTPTVERAA